MLGIFNNLYDTALLAPEISVVIGLAVNLGFVIFAMRNGECEGFTAGFLCEYTYELNHRWTGSAISNL